MAVESTAYLSALPRVSDEPATEPRPPKGLGSESECGTSTADGIVSVLVSELRLPDSPRIAGENTKHTRMLADSEADFPPVIVHRPTMRIIDGLHRLRATVLRGQDRIRVRFFDGSLDDAFVLAVETNVAHGLPLSLADRRAAATRIIRSHPFWSDRAIALVSGLSHKTVGSLRRGLSGEITQLDVRVGRDGRCRPVDSAAGRLAASKLLRDAPDASLREIAQAAGIAVETARNVRKRLSVDPDPVPARQRTPRATDEPPRLAVLTGQRSDAVDARATDTSHSLIERLRGDPSLRHSETGRVLLRLLSVLAVGEDGLERLANHVPQHCTDSVAEAAKQCAVVWRSFAELMRKRQR